MTAGSHSGWTAANPAVTKPNEPHENLSRGKSCHLGSVRNRSRNDLQNSSSINGTIKTSPYNLVMRNQTRSPESGSAVKGLNPTRLPACGYGIYFSMATHSTNTAKPTSKPGMNAFLSD